MSTLSGFITHARVIPYQGTLAALTAENPIPAQGETIVELSTTVGVSSKEKIGDGITRYNDLPYSSGGYVPGSVGSLQEVTDTGDRTSNTMYVGAALTDETQYTDNGIIVKHNGNVYAKVAIDSTTGGGMLAVTEPTGVFGGVILGSTLTDDRIYQLPDASGTLALEGASGSLQEVTAVGADTNIPIFIGDLGANTGVYISAATAQIEVSATSQVGMAMIGMGGGQGTLFMNDRGSNKQTQIKAGTLTTDRVITTPDKDGVLVLGDGGYSSQVLAAASSMTITHGLPYTPSRIQVTPVTSNAGSSGYFVGAPGITSSYFTIGFATPQTGTIAFYWQAYP